MTIPASPGCRPVRGVCGPDQRKRSVDRYMRNLLADRYSRSVCSSDKSNGSFCCTGAKTVPLRRAVVVVFLAPMYRAGPLLWQLSSKQLSLHTRIQFHLAATMTGKVNSAETVNVTHFRRNKCWFLYWPSPAEPCLLFIFIYTITGDSVSAESVQSL